MSVSPPTRWSPRLPPNLGKSCAMMTSRWRRLRRREYWFPTSSTCLISPMFDATGTNQLAVYRSTAWTQFSSYYDIASSRPCIERNRTILLSMKLFLCAEQSTTGIPSSAKHFPFPCWVTGTSRLGHRRKDPEGNDRGNDYQGGHPQALQMYVCRISEVSDHFTILQLICRVFLRVCQRRGSLGWCDTRI